MFFVIRNPVGNNANDLTDKAELGSSHGLRAPLDVSLTYVRRYVAFPLRPRQLEKMTPGRGSPVIIRPCNARRSKKAALQEFCCGHILLDDIEITHIIFKEQVTCARGTRSSDGEFCRLMKYQILIMRILIDRTRVVVSITNAVLSVR
jgi:hypothetical protein